MISITKRVITFLIIAAIITGMLPVIALATDHETVLTSIYQSSAVSKVSVSGSTEATLTVPYAYDGDTVDLSNGLDISYNTSTYSSAVATFASGSEAEIDGDDSVEMTVTYLKNSDSTLYTTLYDIYVVRAAYVAPTFSGTITKTAAATGNITLTATDFTNLYTQNNGGALGSIVITGSNPSFGSLQLSGSSYDFGDSISITSINNGNLTFNATDSGTVSYIVTAYASGDSSTSIGSVVLSITVDIDDDDDFIVTYSTDSDTPLTFDASDFNTEFDDATDETLYYVKFTLPSSSYGVLYYNYTSSSSYGSKVSASTKYYRSASPYLSYVTFVPDDDYSGTVKIAVTGYDSDGESYSGYVKITVDEADSLSQYFTDINSNYSWASDSIDYLYEQGIIYGTSSVSYSPNANITRGDFMLMLYRALNFKATTNGNFSDVSSSSYYYDAIAIAKALGIAQGDGTKFNPSSPITRQDVMVIVARALKVSGITVTSGSTSDLSSYTDKSSISTYATDAVSSLIKAKIIQGSNNKINPKNYITRAEMAVILNRIKKL